MLRRTFSGNIPLEIEKAFYLKRFVYYFYTIMRIVTIYRFWGEPFYSQFCIQEDVSAT